MLKSKNILLAVSGSIAAYKTATLVRLLVKDGAFVKVILSESATQFVTPLTLATLSKNPVVTTFIKDKNGTWNNHVELGLWADVLIIAPATAKTLSAMANGYASNLLIAAYLSAKCPVFFAPAMDLDMFMHPSTKANISKLQQFGNHLIPAGVGELASGLEGEGRMAEPEEIVAQITAYFKNLRNGKKMLITAGPTYEAIDPVRFIGNRSSGKMGYAIAKEAVKNGYEVTLISGPVSIPTVEGLAAFIAVQSAQEMYEAVLENQSVQDVFVMTAAVADFTPKTVAKEKLKKQKNQTEMDLLLTKTPDILAYIGINKKPHQRVVGFALETNDAENNAKIKLASKNADIMVLNSLENKQSGFGYDTNQITIYDNKGGKKAFNLKSKDAVAKDILDYLAEMQ